MTANQINYWSHLENVRHNKAGEVETVRHNKKAENLSARTIKETKRHNLVSESVADRSQKETVRHNKATESAEKSKNKETKRHNKATESAEKSKIIESKRHNLVYESQSGNQIAETKRHNLISEAQGYTSLSIDQQEADAKTTTAKANATQARVASYNARTNRLRVPIEYKNAVTKRIEANSKKWRNKMDVKQTAKKILQEDVNLELKDKKINVDAIVSLLVQGIKSKTDLGTSLIKCFDFF